MISRLFKKIIIFLLLLTVINPKIIAMEQENFSTILDEKYNEANIDEINNNIPENVRKDLNELGINSPRPDEIQNFDITKIFKFIFSKTATIIKTPLMVFLSCIAIMLICSLFNSIKPGLTGSNLDGVLGTLMAVCTCGIVVTPIINCVNDISHTIKNFSNFMLCFIPVFTGIIAMSKGVITSIGYNSAIFLLAQITSSITSGLLLPITGSFLALSISGSINESFNISGITSGVKKVIIFTLSLLVTIFVGIFTVQSSIASNADNMGIKTAKFLSSSFIPIIGGALGDALASIVGGLNIIKSAVGGFGIIVCIVTILPPILTVSSFIILTSISKEISQALEIKTMFKALSAIKDCLSILLAFLICYGILIISTTTVIITMGAK